ncbi:MAG: antitoxin family protein [Anaerolineae bacterium]
MTRAVTAVYENGVLKLLQELPLQESQHVLVIIVPLDAAQEHLSYSPERVADMERQADAWLSQQPADAVREPSPLAPAVRQMIDRAFDEALAAIHSHSVPFDDDEIATDVEATLAEVRSASTPERQRLEAEVQALLDEITADAS